MNEHDIEAEIRRFPRWHYQFNLKGHLTPTIDASKVNRHKQRKKHIFPALVEHMGGSLAGKRVLDLGCNAGFWSLAAIEYECEFVLGIDGRKMHVDQAEFVFDVHGIEKDRYQFIQGDVFDMDLTPYEPFDVVLFLGLMYHINKPVELIEKIAAVNSDTLVIDTTLSTRDGACLELVHEGLDDPRNAINNELVFIPTRQAVCDIVEAVGYDARVLEPAFDSYDGAKDYKSGYRRAFLCRKTAHKGE